MEAIVRNGKIINGKAAEILIKVGLATPVDGTKVNKPKPVKKPVKKKAK